MNFTYTQKTISVLAVAVFMVVAVGSTATNVSAAPHGDYFTDTSQDAENSFTAWFSQFDNADGSQCDSFDAIFTADCLGTTEGNFESLAGVAAWFAQLTGNNNDNDTEETEVVSETSVTLLDQRCFNNEGAVELGFMYVTGYEVTRNGDIYTVGDIPKEDNLNFDTLTDLPDGGYVITVFNDGNTDTLSFNVSCDEEGNGGDDGNQLNAVCSVSPNKPEIDEQVTWEVSASGGDGAYGYSWFGDVAGSNASITTSYGDSGEKEGRVTVSSENVFETVRCTVDVQDEGGGGDVMGVQSPSRTIEEF